MDFERLLPIIPLYGPSYRPVKLAVIYSVLAHRVRRSIVQVGSTKLDLRIPIMVVMSSGYGKKAIKQFIEDTTPKEPGREQNYISPTSRHSEQLVGKTIQDKKGTYIIIRGFLDASFLVIDEAVKFLTHSNFEDARTNIRIALDLYGQNRIKKRLTGIPVQYGLDYFPDCSIVFFIQNVGGGGSSQMPYELLSEGLLRRFVVVYTKITAEERTNGFDSSKTHSDDVSAQKALETAFDNLDKISKGFVVDWDLSKVIDLLWARSHELYDIGVKRGGICELFSEIALYDLLKHLTRMSCVQAGVDGRRVVTVDDVESAFSDFREIWNLHLDFVAEMIRQTLGADVLDEIKVRALRFLSGRGAISEATSDVSIRELLAQIDGLSESRYRRLRELGFIGRIQNGKIDTRVWITEKGIRRLSEIDDS